MGQRLILAVLLVLLFGFAAEAQDCNSCIKHTPYARYMEHVRLIEPGETVVIEVLFRNADGCGCAPTCFRLSQGYHPPHDGTVPLRVFRTKLRTADDRAMPYVCLDPGQEATGAYYLEADIAQDGPGFVTPSVFMFRANPTWDFTVDTFDTEGPAVCAGMTYTECRAKVYAPQAPTP
jgi:hypothetical protein